MCDTEIQAMIGQNSLCSLTYLLAMSVQKFKTPWSSNLKMTISKDISVVRFLISETDEQVR